MTLAQPAATSNTLQGIIQAFGQHKMHLSEDQAGVLVRGMGLDPLRALFRGDSEDLQNQRKDAYYLARVMARLEQNGMAVSIEEARALAAGAGRQALAQRLVDAFQDRNQTALRALQLQIETLRRNQESDGDAPPPAPDASQPHRTTAGAQTSAMGRSPIHRTALAPPVARPVETAQAGESVAVTPTQPAQRRQDNVRPISPPARRDDRDDRDHRGQASDDRRGYSDPEPTSRQHAPAGDPLPQGDARYDQHSCFGKDVAVTFECTPNKERTAKTVNFKVAKAKGASCKQGVDWANGIIIALEPHEVETILAVLWKMGEKVRYAGHGRDNQKWFELSESTGDFAGALRLTVAHGQDIRRINIGATDVARVIGIFVRAAMSHLNIPSELLPPTVRRSYDLYLKNAERRAASAQGQGQQAPQRRAG